MKIGILGAGVIGLSTAYRLIEVYGNSVEISIIAKTFSKQTTSDGAGGLYRPDDRFMPGVKKETARQWCVDSWKYFDQLLFSENGGKAGVFQVSGYQLFNDKREDPSYKDIIYQFRHLRQDELNMFRDKYNDGYFATTICVDVRAFMKYLTDILVLNNVKFIQNEIKNFDDFVENSSFDVVYNCAGLEAGKLCNDPEIIPIRGQMIRVKAPWVKHFYYTDDNCYLIPNMETLCLGGTRQVGDFRDCIDIEDSKGIFERCKRLCPSLENATIEWEWTGLRPHRKPTRVEKEIFIKKTNGQRVTVIHNYGHGGNGISLSRGTAIHAVKLLMEQKSKL